MILALMLLLTGNPIASFDAAARRVPADVPAERLEELDALAAEIAAGRNEVVFICTHNSRRSHFAQLWAQAAAFHCGLNDVRTFSGGTEVTAFNPRAIASLERMGWQVATTEPDAKNPRRFLSAEGVPVQALRRCSESPKGLHRGPHLHRSRRDLPRGFRCCGPDFAAVCRPEACGWDARRSSGVRRPVQRHRCGDALCHATRSCTARKAVIR